MSGFNPVRFTAPVSADHSAMLQALPWHPLDVSIKSTNSADTMDSWCGPVIKFLHRYFPPDDVRLARAIEKYQLHLEAKDLRSSAKYAYNLGDELWRLRRFHTAENLWKLGAQHFISASDSNQVADDSAVILQLMKDNVLGHYSFEWGENKSDHLVKMLVGEGFQGEAKKIFGKNLVIKSPRSSAELDPRNSSMISTRDQNHHRRKTLGREIKAMQDLQQQGYRIAEIHYVDPDYHFCIKDLITGPNHRGLMAYGLSDEQVELALEKYHRFIAKDPAVENIGSNVIYDVNTSEWTIIDA